MVFRVSEPHNWTRQNFKLWAGFRAARIEWADAVCTKSTKDMRGNQPSDSKLVRDGTRKESMN